MLEHSAMYLNVTPPYEDDAAFLPDFYTRLGPCELQDPVWAKMSALATGVNKKRKKSETKPQAQINKCNNEKRRREQENIYIEELAELISANIADMSSLSVKPDKCAILQETVNQIKRIKQQQESAAQNSEPVQQGEVSSSRTPILSNDMYGPLLLEALEGFLFVVNSEGRVEHVTENVSTYIRFNKEDLEGKSIYNFIHHGDHARFSSSLLPMTIGWSSSPPTSRSRPFNIRLLVKPPDDQEESVEEKQQRMSSYEYMYISSIQLKDQVSSEEDGSDSGPCLLCVASRISHRDRTNCTIEQFTTKLDTSGKIICVDTSGVSPNISHFIKKELMGRVLRELVAQQEVQKINAHLRETVSAGQSTSQMYRLQIASDKFVQVQTKSKLFKGQASDPDFIMATHSIIGDYETVAPNDPGGGNSCSSSSVGGPLMTSVVNGNARNGNSAPVSSGSDSSTASNNMMSTATSTFTTFNLESDFNFQELYPPNTWDGLEGSNWSEPRPDSRQSVTPVSTPRPPSNPSTVTQSPLAHYIQQSPATPAANPYSSSFPFSPMAEEAKDTKANVLEESNRLRHLLTNPPHNNSMDNSNSESSSKDKILKELLKQEDDDGGRSDNRGQHLLSRSLQNSEPQKSSTSGNENNMLRQLLNEKNDEDDLEAKAGVKKKSELLQQLLKSENRDGDDDKKNERQEDTLLQSLGFNTAGGENRGRKRPSDDRDDNPNKRSLDGQQVSSSGHLRSKLCEKNKMLAQLLAQEPTKTQPIPPVPASEIMATPQEKLPRIADQNALLKNHQMSLMQQQQQNARVNNVRIQLQRSQQQQQQQQQATNYLSSQLQQAVNQNLQRQVASGCFTSPATSSTDNNNTGWENNNMQNDLELSVILDEVIDHIPDDVMHLLGTSEAQQTNNFHTTLSETMAINIIQKNLMQCESVVKSPASPISLPGTPPAYSTANTNQQGNFPPPPNYPQQNIMIKRGAGRQGAPQYAQTNNNLSRQQLLSMQRNKLQQEQQKQRLLQMQKQQHMLIPSNATSADMTQQLQNIDTLLNTTVAPNVSLQRSSSVPESQLSPNFQQQLGQSRISNRDQPYSPHSQLTSPIGQQGGFSQQQSYQQASRLSPQSQFSQQLSPRQAYPQQNAAAATWQQQQQQRMTVQQQNSLLNQQLAGGFRNFQRGTPQQQQQQQNRQQSSSGGGPINSPGAVATRHSPYPQQQEFQAPSSPSNVQAYQQQQQQNQYLRLQRANSAPTATTQLPGGTNAAPTSEFVRQELRAALGARTAQAQAQPQSRPPSGGQMMQQQQQSQQQQQVVELDGMGLGFDMTSDFYGGGGSTR
ncbi:unnamed protein product [Brassicogethes aeneus]|uniref:Nuclear receptor coactivator 2 n=1 Tax=Brassicogethes aeneus TaxID=1431903 RepID=A0A9P0BA32_BRAAE|nr:unnamed protein product [Brassicogethes aeneus]